MDRTVIPLVNQAVVSTYGTEQVGELELLLCGVPTLDCEDWQAHTGYEVRAASICPQTTLQPDESKENGFYCTLRIVRLHV